MSNKFKIIPVLDLKDGIVVHGVRGERDKYQPVKSMLTASAEMPDVIDVFVKQLGLREFYLADLDAIISRGQKTQLDLINQKKKLGSASLSFMVDAGVTDVNSVEKIIKAGADKVVIGTETVPSLKVLGNIVKTFGSERLIMSIDMLDLKILSPSKKISQMTSTQGIVEISRTGINQFIILELDRVGTGLGINKPLIVECLAALKGIAPCGTLITGGGVSGYEDLKWLAENGVTGVLVASALHSGMLDKKMLRTLEELQ
ncbi:MAG: HisA/HisF-related TIM barrel protein [Dehalobacterium sp.]